MSSFFDAYAAIGSSGLFDARFYLATYPEVAQTHSDPLVHYIECGAEEGRVPHRQFDVEYYYKQCALAGEQPVNPLLHFVTVGAARGYRPRRDSVSADAQTPDAVQVVDPLNDLKMVIETPQVVDERAVSPVRGNLFIRGWALARSGVAGIDVAIDGVHITSAHYGSKRIDVSRAFADWPDALHSGFAANIPSRALPPGEHIISLTLRNRHGASATADIRVEALGSACADGPGALRQKMPEVEVRLLHRRLAELGRQPIFYLFVLIAGEADAAERLRSTLGSVRDQEYAHWRLVVVAPGVAMVRAGLADVIAQFSDLANRLTVVTDTVGRAFSAFIDADPGTAWIAILQAGDRLGCDALLRVALAGALHPATDLLYSDERRRTPANGAVEPFFKPGWSPDLLLSTNYLGRLWCAAAAVWEGSRLTLGDAFKYGEYDLALRCAEAAAHIVHLPQVLCEHGPDRIDTDATERSALERALTRRGISGTVVAGEVAGTFRVRRTLATEPLVSIIIPTCAARGLIRTCITTIRAKTAYRNYEIICIENIPATQPEDKTWLARHADVIIPTEEPFNWSRFNNLAVVPARGDYFLFLNDDIEIIEADWLACLVGEAQRAEAGVVGPLLLYPDGSIQHAGIVLADIGRARHPFRCGDDASGGYFGLALTQRNVIAVTGACLMTRRDVFTRLGGFDEAHTIVNNDVDYCLRAREQGLLTVYTPHARLIHHELASRAELGDAYDADAFAGRWAMLHAKGDPFYHRHLSRESDNVSADPEPVEEVYCGRPLLRRDAIRRILVLKLDHIGDCMTALPAIRRLKSLFPAARLTILAAPWSRPLWAREPAIDEVIEFQAFHQRSALGQTAVSDDDLAALAARLAPCRFDLAVDLRKSPDLRAILRRTGARWLAGYDREGEFHWLDIALEWDVDRGLQRKRRHVADDLLALVDAIAAACAEDDVAEEEVEADTIAEAARLLPPEIAATLFGRPVVCVHPAAGNPLRQWPREHFAALIDLLVDDYDVHAALIGTADDRPLVNDILAGVRRPEAVRSLAGLLSLGDLPSFLRACTLFVSNNSGPQHLAASLGVATVAIHSGVVDAREWGPRGARAIALRRMMNCSPCYLERAEDCPRALACLNHLLPGAVYDSCRLFLARFE